ncbi:MAG TPA: PHP-associated domain-containing protein [Terriglobia bacterium]|nr:PHP-associated domain-containing protein [Terriglobia bacterium]
MKLDAHVHTLFSGKTTIYPIHNILNESYNPPELVYSRAKARGMDLVAITDHDTIDGALTLADRPDLIIGEEITAIFPEDKVTVHIGVLDINEQQHREIQRLRRNIHELMPYLKSQGIFATLNHLASQTAGRLTAAHIGTLIPWVDGLEVLNGSRLPSQNRTAAALAEAYSKVGVAGSDSHTFRGLGKTYMVADHASNKSEFMAALRNGRIRVEGKQGHYFTLASDIVRITCCFYRQGVVDFAKSPLEWRRQAMVLVATLGLPLTVFPLVGALVHFILDDRFNRSLLFDLIARPAEKIPSGMSEAA